MGSELRDTGKERDSRQLGALPSYPLLLFCPLAPMPPRWAPILPPHTANLVSLMATDGPMLMIMLVRGRLGRGLI